MQHSTCHDGMTSPPTTSGSLTWPSRTLTAILQGVLSTPTLDVGKEVMHTLLLTSVSQVDPALKCEPLGYRTLPPSKLESANQGSPPFSLRLPLRPLPLTSPCLIRAPPRWVHTSDPVPALSHRDSCLPSFSAPSPRVSPHLFHSTPPTTIATFAPITSRACWKLPVPHSHPPFPLLLPTSQMDTPQGEL